MPVSGNGALLRVSGSLGYMTTCRRNAVRELLHARKMVLVALYISVRERYCFGHSYSQAAVGDTSTSFPTARLDLKRFKVRGQGLGQVRTTRTAGARLPAVQSPPVLQRPSLPKLCRHNGQAAAHRAIPSLHDPNSIITQRGCTLRCLSLNE
jgi:hypothetical protein